MNARRRSIRRVTRVWTAASLLAAVGAVIALSAGTAAAATGCRLGPGGSIRHVIIVQFDNVHLVRDNSNVPSDIQQIPALYDFMRDNGTLLANDHTVLISHTADGILSTETGLYPDEFGGGVANTYPYLNPKAKSGTSTTSLLKYWTDPTSSTDPLFTLIHSAASSGNPEGINTPAPWASFTRAGCDFAGVGSADMEFENDTTDVSNVYGANSPQFAFGNWSFNTAFDQKAPDRTSARPTSRASRSTARWPTAPRAGSARPRTGARRTRCRASRAATRVTTRCSARSTSIRC